MQSKRPNVISLHPFVGMRRLLFVTALVLFPTSVLAQSTGDASIRVDYQYLHAENFKGAAGLEADYWSTDTQLLTL